MENNENKIYLDQLKSGFSGLINMLDSNIAAMKKNMTKEQAIEFAEQMNKSDIPGKIDEIRAAHKQMKNDLDIS